MSHNINYKSFDIFQVIYLIELLLKQEILDIINRGSVN